MESRLRWDISQKYGKSGHKQISSETLEAWYDYFATGDASYFGELMDTFYNK